MTAKANSDATKYGKDYTKPALRARLKKKIQASDKGGRPGQWSARKSQLLAVEYRKQGGGFKHAKGKPQRDLEKWTEEKWQTKKGTARARKGRSTSRYLPKKAWSMLSPEERERTDAKKRAASKRGEQFVSNTSAAKRVRRRATK